MFFGSPLFAFRIDAHWKRRKEPSAGREERL
jgi:hypothetical protein